MTQRAAKWAKRHFLRDFVSKWTEKRGHREGKKTVQVQGLSAFTFSERFLRNSMKGQKKKQESRHWHSAVKADAEVLLTGAPPVAWMQLYRPRGVLLQSEHTWAHSHSYESYLRVLSGNTRSRLERDWQFLCCKPDAAGDSTNERKSWRDLCLMPQRHFLPPHPPLRGKIQGLWLSRLLKSYVMLAFFSSETWHLWCTLLLCSLHFGFEVWLFNICRLLCSTLGFCQTISWKMEWCGTGRMD